MFRERQQDCLKHWHEFQRRIEKAVRFSYHRDYRNQIMLLKGTGEALKSGVMDAKWRLDVITSFTLVCFSHTKQNEAHATKMMTFGSIVFLVSARMFQEPQSAQSSAINALEWGNSSPWVELFQTSYAGLYASALRHKAEELGYKPLPNSNVLSILLLMFM